MTPGRACMLRSGRVVRRYCLVNSYGRVGHRRRNPRAGRTLCARMRAALQQSQVDQAALETYLLVRADGGTHDCALRRAILLWLRHFPCADGREARIRVTQVLSSAQAMAPRDYDDWLILASGDALWGEGAPAAIHRLSIDCRALGISADGGAMRTEDLEAVGVEVLREYLRTELPRKVWRLRRLAYELLSAERERTLAM
jgi:hypothetical protein